MLGILTTFEIVTVLIVAQAHIFAVWFQRHFPKAARWLLDFSSGLGIGYAFLYLLPKIGNMTNQVTARQPDAHVLFEHQLYFFLLAGFLLYYLVDFKAGSRRPSRVGMALNELSFIAYSALVGVTIAHLNSPLPEVYAVSAVVFTLHLFGVNSFLIKMYPDDFQSWMRWSFVAAMVAGVFLGTTIEKYDPYQSVATALVGGIIIILSVRLKLPARERVNARAFLIGVATAVAAVSIYAAGSTL